MIRAVSIAIAAEALLLSLCQTSSAASDITIAAIATGRLYVVGTTERPHQPVVLDGQFQTESDEAGKFQYELIYHPARCIVSALIDGKAYEAVVGNCGQQGPLGSTASSAPMKGAASAGLATQGPSGPPGPQGPAGPSGPTATPDPATTLILGSGTSASVPPVAPTPMINKPRGETSRTVAKSMPIAQPPVPPQRPAIVTATSARAVRSPPPVRKPKPKPKPQTQPDDLAPNDD